MTSRYPEFDRSRLHLRPLAERQHDMDLGNYYRPFKTVLVRTVRDGGKSYYVRGDHRATMPALHALLVERMKA